MIRYFFKWFVYIFVPIVNSESIFCFVVVFAGGGGGSVAWGHRESAHIEHGHPRIPGLFTSLCTLRIFHFLAFSMFGHNIHRDARDFLF